MAMVFELELHNWQSGYRCQVNLEILTVLMALNDSWKQFFSAITSVTSALEIL